jgi:N-methylhydantoinase A/oxoprolinase/acetone carboxylase beta subunit
VQVGADSGGTFTDVVGSDGRIAKMPSTPEDPGAAVRTGMAQVGDGRPALLSHGTTVATNALLERSGATVALVTTEGFADVVEIARQHRPSLYDPWVDRPEPLVARSHRLEVVERVAADGTVLVPYVPGTVPQVPEGTEAVAVCLLHSDLHPVHELQVAADLAAGGWDVSASCQVSPEFREYERTVTTVVNAYLRPVCGPYLDGLAGAADEVLVMSSGGGLMDLPTAAERPAALLLSGPAAGVQAAAQVAVACGFPDAVTFDMGGTSTDVCLVLDGAPAPASERTVAGFPVRLPSLDVHTIGAGGGSIAALDPGGALVVGPRSAGAVPGPACYGHGGTEPTVTDADLVLGRIPSGSAFPGLGTLDMAAAVAALERAGVSAEGVVAVVEAGMEQAVRTVSVERGVDPAGLALVAFGGAGPLHACALAESLGMAAVVVPGAAGVLSAVGLLVSRRRAERVRSWPTPGDTTGLDDSLAQLSADALADLRDPSATVTTWLDCRYAGQSHELRVATVGDFPAEHERRNGYRRQDGTPVEVVAVRAVAEGAAPASVHDVLAGWADRWDAPVVGPCTVTREDCTIWVPKGWTGEPGPLGALVLRRTAAGPAGGIS